MTPTKYPTTRDQADEWARIETHEAMKLLDDLRRELELRNVDELVPKLYALHGSAFHAGRLTGLPD